MKNDLENVSLLIKDLISKKNYPCIAAIQSLNQHEIEVGTFANLGSGQSVAELGRALTLFKEHQKQTNSIYLSYWASFIGSTFETEEAFEQAMWRELSLLSASEPPDTPWDPHFSSDPRDKNFCFSYGGDAFFLVGLHPTSSRLARQFPYPTIVFNLYEQFEELHREGKYEPMIKTNRHRDLKFQGSVNPMVEQHSDIWEAIQFSGRANPPDWKCPFHRDSKP